MAILAPEPLGQKLPGIDPLGPVIITAQEATNMLRQQKAAKWARAAGQQAASLLAAQGFVIGNGLGGASAGGAGENTPGLPPVAIPKPTSVRVKPPPPAGERLPAKVPKLPPLPPLPPPVLPSTAVPGPAPGAASGGGGAAGGGGAVGGSGILLLIGLALLASFGKRK